MGRLVLDEAQQVKNPGTAQARAVRRSQAGRRVALTGTPVENRLAELWSLMHVLNPGLLGRPRRSASASRCRSSATATPRPPSCSGGSRRRSCCAG